MNPLSVICLLINARSKEQMLIRALFDNCSNVTVLRRAISDQLKLGHKKVDISFTGTGGFCSLFQDQEECEFLLSTLDGRYTSPLIQCVTIPVIAKNFRRPVLNPKDYGHLKHIEDFTEDYTKQSSHKSVDLLIGHPFEPHLGQMSKILGSNVGEPIAIITKLGTCISAPLTPPSVEGKSLAVHSCETRPMHLEDQEALKETQNEPLRNPEQTQKVRDEPIRQRDEASSSLDQPSPPAGTLAKHYIGQSKDREFKSSGQPSKDTLATRSLPAAILQNSKQLGPDWKAWSGANTRRAALQEAPTQIGEHANATSFAKTNPQLACPQTGGSSSFQTWRLQDTVGYTGVNSPNQSFIESRKISHQKGPILESPTNQPGVSETDGLQAGQQMAGGTISVSKIEILSTNTERSDCPPLPNSEQSKNVSQCIETGRTFIEKAEQELLNWMKLDQIGLKDSPEENNDVTSEELACREKILQGTKYDEEKRQYTTSLPWKAGPITETNRDQAYALSMAWRNKLSKKDPDLLEAWIKTYQEGKEWGFFTEVPPEDLGKTEGFHYVSTFPVKQLEKITQPCRLVFQANQKMKNSGLTLNDHLHKGQDILTNLVTMVIGFRAHRYVFNLDISRMFHRFALSPSDQEKLRFFAITKNDEGKIVSQSWRCSTLPFGLNASPYIACLLMQQHTQKFLSDAKLGTAARQIIGNSYMDDVLIKCNDEKSLATEVKNADHILSLASLPTHKYVSNSTKALSEFPQDKLSSKEKISVLGTIWDPKKGPDNLQFHTATKY